MSFIVRLFIPRILGGRWTNEEMGYIFQLEAVKEMCSY